MTILLLVPTVLSLLLAAHFMRSGNVALTVISLLPLALLRVKRVWAARTLQILLLLGAVEWCFTTYAIVQQRQAAGESWLRSAIILAAVAALNLFAALLFRTERLARRYSFVSK